ncbi:hypothetical protein LXL04_039824 [Taraxacum kok-saghyz]
MMWENDLSWNCQIVPLTKYALHTHPRYLITIKGFYKYPNPIFKSLHSNLFTFSMEKPVAIICLLSISLLINNGNAFQFMVGGSGDWSLASTSYNQWAEQSRFQIGDTVLFKYGGKDSVVQVTKEDYNNCNPASPIAKYEDGHSMVKLNESGPHYFISGLVENCKKNEKIVIIVMAPRGSRSPAASSPPSPAPAGEESPSPPPAGDESQSPPPAPATEDSNPTPSPNVATSIVTSFVYYVIAFVGSSLVFVF